MTTDGDFLTIDPTEDSFRSRTYSRRSSQRLWDDFVKVFNDPVDDFNRSEATPQ